jgi:hypothetical protein
MIEAPRAAAESVSASTSSAQSAVLNGDDLVIGGNVAFHILFGTNPTATTSCLRVPADTMLRFRNINPGEKFAVILASGSGTVQYTAAI